MYHVGFSNRLGVSQNSIWRQNLPPTARSFIGRARMYYSVYIIRSTDLFFSMVHSVHSSHLLLLLFVHFIHCWPLKAIIGILLWYSRVRVCVYTDGGYKPLANRHQICSEFHVVIRARASVVFPSSLPCRIAPVVVVCFNGKTNFAFFNFYNDQRRRRGAVKMSVGPSSVKNLLPLLIISKRPPNRIDIFRPFSFFLTKFALFCIIILSGGPGTRVYIIFSTAIRETKFEKRAHVWM